MIAPRTAGPDNEASWWVLALAGLALVVPALLLPHVGNQPAGLPSSWVAVGVATALLVHPSWRDFVGPIGVSIVSMQMLTAPTPQAGLAHAGVAILQAALAAWVLLRCWVRLHDDRRPLYRIHLTLGFQLAFVVALPVGLAGAVLTAGVLAITGVPQPLQVALYHGAASALSIVLWVPLLWRHRLSPKPTLRHGLCLLAALLSAALSVVHPAALVLVPLATLLAGAVGGYWLASAATLLIGATLLVATQWLEVPAFEGPEGFVVFLQFMVRVAAAGYVLASWFPHRKIGWALPGEAGQAWRDVRDLAADVLQRQGRVRADTTIVLLRVDGGPRAFALRHSQTLWAVAHRTAEVLRPGDAVAPLTDGVLLLWLPRCPAVAVGSVLARVDQRLRLAPSYPTTLVVCEHGNAARQLLASSTWMVAQADEQEINAALGSPAEPHGAPADAPRDEPRRVPAEVAPET